LDWHSGEKERCFISHRLLVNIIVTHNLIQAQSSNRTKVQTIDDIGYRGRKSFARPLRLRVEEKTSVVVWIRSHLRENEAHQSIKGANNGQKDDVKHKIRTRAYLGKQGVRRVLTVLLLLL
jgi:hypothetical protein